MKTKPFQLLVAVLLLVGGMASTAEASAECLRMKVAGIGTAKPVSTAVMDREAAAREALALAIVDWEAKAAENPGPAYANYVNAQGKDEVCQPLFRNLMSPIECIVTATPCEAEAKLMVR